MRKAGGKSCQFLVNGAMSPFFEKKYISFDMVAQSRGIYLFYILFSVKTFKGKAPVTNNWHDPPT